MAGFPALISDEVTRRNIAYCISELFEDLRKFGFSEPRLSTLDWSTKITLFSSEIALEVEIDWREFEIFVLVVRLENGKIPSGYYVSQGKPCRIHLQRMIKQYNWQVDQESLRVISLKNAIRNRKATRSEEQLIQESRAYVKVLESCAENLVKNGAAVFDAF